jgi:tryptophan 7-halogenase
MDKPVKTVIIAGGGSAGWIAAGRIAARNGGALPDGVRVILIESPGIGTIGVGEGTWPTMRNTLRKIGIRETDFFRHADAAFKQGAKFVQWTTGHSSDGYYHPLNPPQGAAQINLSGHWERERREKAWRPQATDFAYAVDFQADLCEAGLAPKSITTPEYAGIANYAYHLDAGKFATLLRDHATANLGVRHIQDDIVAVHQDEATGDVTGLTLKEGGRINGDFFVDCTGFASLLLGKTFGTSFIDRSDTLFCDRALALQIPYESEDAPVACHTISTAQEAGWIWDIGLPTRRGLGYVYSSRHIDDERAQETLMRYAGPMGKGLTPRLIAIRSGHRASFWERNCVAVGLSAGFLEPLEASALMLIETAVDIIADRLPTSLGDMPLMARQFNRSFRHHWDRIIEFLKLHYVLTKRTDTAFWRDNVDPASIPQDLQDKLVLWRCHPPTAADFSHQPEVFSWPSYQYILHGMGFETDYARLPAVRVEEAAAQRWFAAADKARAQTLRDLPRHRELLRKIRDYGMQPV